MATKDNCPYFNYSGPVLVKATLDDEDITTRVQEMYGPLQNWRNRLWSCADFLTEADVGKELYLEFPRKNGHLDFTKLTIPENLSIVMNNPLFTPFCE